MLFNCDQCLYLFWPDSLESKEYTDDCNVRKEIRKQVLWEPSMVTPWIILIKVCMPSGKV